MKKRMMRCGSITLVLVFLFVFAGEAEAAPKYQWRLACETIAGSIADLYAQEFARLLKEKSNGDIQLDIFHSGTLGTPTEIASRFGSPNALREAIAALSDLLYVA